MLNKSLVSIDQCTKEDILRILENARKFEENPDRRLLEGKIAATLFFEPSTRTRLSFETSVNRLGGRVIGFQDASTTSSSKGETLKDTILMVSNYADVIIMRHHLEGAARYASEVTKVPIINAGDGANQHPSQTLLDLYSIKKTQGTLDNLTITMVGDLKYGRTIHSLIVGMSHFHPTFHFIAPEELKMPEEQKHFCRTHDIGFHEHTVFSEDIINQTDILYMTRVQRERFTDLLNTNGSKMFMFCITGCSNIRVRICAYYIRCRACTRSLTMWMVIRRRITSSRRGTVFLPARRLSAMCWALI